MTRFQQSIVGLFFIGYGCVGFSWNAVGHRLVAHIAYQYMTPHARQTFDRYNQAMDVVYKPQSFDEAAVWLDRLGYQGIAWYATLHFVDLPFSLDPTLFLPPPQTINAISAIEKSKAVLRNKYAKAFDKGLALRILMHVTGDLHQPLHAVTKISAIYPKGDRGGNLVFLHRNGVASTLHAYWDRGGGLLVNNRHTHPSETLPLLTGTCLLQKMDLDPKKWAKESHALAVSKAYGRLPVDQVLTQDYQQIVQRITKKRLFLAGCRLAALLNQLDF